MIKYVSLNLMEVAEMSYAHAMLFLVNIITNSANLNMQTVIHNTLYRFREWPLLDS